MVHGVAKIKHDLATKRNKRQVDYSIWEFPDSSVGKEPTCKAGDPGLIPGLGRFPWRREWQPTPVFLPGEFHGQGSLMGYRLWGHKSQT